MSFLTEYMSQMVALYKKYEKIIVPIIKFLVALVWLFYLDVKLGQSPYLDKSYVLVGIAFASMWLPISWFVAVMQLVLLSHLLGISLVAGGIGFVLLVLYYIFYFRLAPEDTWMLMGIPMAMVLHLSLVPAVVLGLRSKLRSVIGIILSCVFYAYTLFITERIGRFTESYVNQALSIFKGFSISRDWIAYSLIFSITMIAVYIIRRLHIEYSFVIATVIGVLIFIITYLVVLKYFNMEYHLVKFIWNIGLGGLLLLLYKSIYHRLDYTRTENLQFEDDDYYYYVKAIPKVKALRRKKQVDNI